MRTFRRKVNERYNPTTTDLIYDDLPKCGRGSFHQLCTNMTGYYEHIQRLSSPILMSSIWPWVVPSKNQLIAVPYSTHDVLQIPSAKGWVICKSFRICELVICLPDIFRLYWFNGLFQCHSVGTLSICRCVWGLWQVFEFFWYLKGHPVGDSELPAVSEHRNVVIRWPFSVN